MRDERDALPTHDVLPFQPSPINFQVLHETVGGHTETTIGRVWRLEDVRNCPLCAVCTATVGRLGSTAFCLKKVNAFVSIDDAPSFRDPTGGSIPNKRPGASA